MRGLDLSRKHCLIRISHLASIFICLGHTTLKTISGWIDGWIDGWIRGLMFGWTDGGVDEWRVTWVGR